MIEPTQAHNPDSPTVTSSPQGEIALGDAPLTAPVGYELETLIGEGGMGVVYRARDLAMSRDVAVKILQSRFSPKSSIGQRFVEEARITGQLQHPGIPPVHQVGTLPDGRPFLAMKLIKGDTLDELLKRRGDPGTERGRYLGVFEHVAQAVGYAHAHNVIHRDLKPANIMVGSFGEVQVMDWGLAKVLDAGHPQETLVDEAKLATEIRSLRDGAEVTQAGSLLGTPAFMPPEQAIGAVDQISARSDVFGLGALLCVILTGQPPFHSASSESTRQMAARAKLDEAFARLDRCGAEPELIALTKRCLAAEPGDRPGDGGEVAVAITALRADAERRAHEAEMERARAEVRSAEERKRRRVKLALLLAVFTLIAVAGFAAWGIESARAQNRADQLTREAEQKSREAELLSRQLATERDIVSALNEAQFLREEGWKEVDDPMRWALTLTAARSSFKRAESLLKSGGPSDEIRARVSAIGNSLSQDERDRDLLAQLDKIEEDSDIRFMIPIILTGTHAERYSNAFKGYGLDLLGMPRSDAVALLKGHRFRDRLLTAVRNWENVRPITDMRGVNSDFTIAQAIRPSAAIAGEPVVQLLLNRPSIRHRLNDLLMEVNDDPFVREWHDALSGGKAENIKKLLLRPEFHRLSTRELSSFVDDLLASTLINENYSILAEVLAISYDRFPGDYWVNFRLGAMGMNRIRKPDKSEADAVTTSIRYLTAAVAARPRSAMPRVALAMTLLQESKNDPAGLKLLRGASTLDPSSPWPHLMMGYSAMELGNFPELLASFREAVRLDPEISFFMIYSLMELGIMEEGVSSLKNLPSDELLKFYDDLIALQPDNSGGYLLRATYKHKQGDYRQSLVDYRKALSLCPVDAPYRGLTHMSVSYIEAIARWEAKLPLILKGELKPTNGFQLLELAEYCMGFEKKFLLAVRFVSDAFAAEPALYLQFNKVPQVGTWAMSALAGKGVDAGNLSENERSKIRKSLLTWFREAKAKVNKDFLPLLANQLWTEPAFAPIRDPQEIAKLPPEEGAEWTKFWKTLPKKEEKFELAPAPRNVSRDKP